ncbi:DMT family transporter [Acidisoma silvae]|uniref:DMT family transporter n=1 Tax=Acidisoma silvae TaxID=2802396 RepID=A0A964DZS4_9PROT|nr:DMT family transporter [Acidisoma silvae]MCB8876780.1 DMT family transporter [Acidisoma silvae]
MQANQSSSAPVLAAALGVCALTFMDALMKRPSMTYPLGEVIELRYLAASFFAAIVFLIKGERRPTWNALRRNASRALAMLTSTACFFVALARLPLAEAIALSFIAPLLLTLMGRFILKEPIASKSMVGVILGLIGVVVIALGNPMRGGHAFDLPGLAGALGAAFFYALSNVLMRRQTTQDSLQTIVLLSNSWAALFCLPFLIVQWRPPTTAIWTAVTFGGLMGACGHFCLGWAYARAHAGRLGILEYSAFFWGAILGFVFFGEIPTLTTIIGASLILVACIGTTGARPRGFRLRQSKN